MARPDLETRMRRFAIAALAVTISVATGAGVAQWAVADTNGFYMAPIDHYGSPAYARRQPVADTFWQQQDEQWPARPAAQAEAVSTATSAQPAYRSASGS